MIDKSEDVNEEFLKIFEECWDKLRKTRKEKRKRESRKLTTSEKVEVDKSIIILSKAYEKKLKRDLKNIHDIDEKYELFTNIQNRINSIIEYGQDVLDVNVEIPCLKIKLIKNQDSVNEQQKLDNWNKYIDSAMKRDTIDSVLDLVDMSEKIKQTKAISIPSISEFENLDIMNKDKIKDESIKVAAHCIYLASQSNCLSAYNEQNRFSSVYKNKYKFISENVSKMEDDLRKSIDQEILDTYKDKDNWNVKRIYSSIKKVINSSDERSQVIDDNSIIMFILNKLPQIVLKALLIIGKDKEYMPIGA